MSEEKTYGPELAKALVQAQKTAQSVAKDKENQFHLYKYASAEAIVEEARGALTSAGLAVMPLTVGRDPDQPDHVWMGEGNDAFIASPRRVLATYRLLHESGQHMDFSSTTPVIPEKGRPEDKAEFGSRTELLGYALRDLLLIPRGTEGAETPSARDDRETPSPKPPAPKARASAEPKSNPKADNLSRLLTAAEPDGCGWSGPACEAWAKKRFGKTRPNELTDVEIQAATTVALAFMAGGEPAQLAKEAEYVVAGIMKGDPKGKAA